MFPKRKTAALKSEVNSPYPAVSTIRGSSWVPSMFCMNQADNNKLCLLFPQVGRCGLLSACLSSKNRLQKHVCNHPACTLVPALTYQNPSDAKCATCALEIKLSGQRAILSISWTFMPRCELSRQWTGWNETLTPQLEFCWWLQWRTPQKWHLGSLTAAPSAPWPAWEKRRKPVRTWASAPNVFSTSFWCIWFILGSKTSLRLEVTSWGQGKLWEAASSTKPTVMNYDLHHAVTVFTTFLEQNEMTGPDLNVCGAWTTLTVSIIKACQKEYFILKCPRLRQVFCGL